MATMHELPVILTPDEDGGFVVECPVIPGCISQGDTRDEALTNIREAIDAYFDAAEKPAITRLHFLRDEVLTW